MIPHKNDQGLVEWFEHPKPVGKTLVYKFVKDCGLGNQLMEINAAYGIAKRTGCHFRWMWEESKLRTFELGPLGFGLMPPVDTPRLCGLLGQGNIKIVREMERRIRETAPPLFTLSSPFQCEGAFIEDTTLIDGYIRPNLPPMKLPNPRGTTPVGVQVRRTDYVGHNRLDVVTRDYFRNAMEWMRGQVKNPHFLIVSDDPAWCAEEFKDDDATPMPPQDSIEGLRTLVSCKHWIISNSTYGYWGAWLGESAKGGKVVVPEIWHHVPGSYGDWKPAPERWKRITIKPAARIEPVPLRDDEIREPRHERAVVYPWSHIGPVWQELRYSMRSIEKFFQDDCPIYILGTAEPPGLIDNKRTFFLPAHSYRQALIEGVQVADKVLWMNDDIVLLRDTTWEDCERTLYIRDVGEDFIRNAGPQENPWRAGCIHVLRDVRKRHPRKKLRVYSTHTPYVYEREKALEVLRRSGSWEKHPFELDYFHEHAKRPTQIDETWRVQGLPFGEARFLNWTDGMLTQELRDAIGRLLPEKAGWEV